MGKALAFLDVTQSALSFLYWGTAGLLLYAAIRGPKTLMRKTLYAVAAAIAFGYWPTASVIAQSEAKRYREAAWAHFQKRCRENAGEKIYRTVDSTPGNNAFLGYGL